MNFNSKMYCKLNSEKVINAGVASPYAVWILQLTEPIKLESSDLKDAILQLDCTLLSINKYNYIFKIQI